MEKFSVLYSKGNGNFYERRIETSVNEESFIKEVINEIIQLIEKLSQSGNYDIVKLLYAIRHKLSQLVYLYCNLAKDKDPEQIVYKISKKPRINQMAYVNIGRGFPKELMDGHWCYIVKDMGVKAIVIPSTSIKNESKTINPFYEMDIIVKDKDEIETSRLQLSDMRTIDYQRIDFRKEFYTVLTPRKQIMKFVKKNLFD